MQVYSPNGKSYVHIAKIAKNEIKKMSIEIGQQPREKLQTFYNRQTDKPTLLVNLGLFGMNSQGLPCFSLVSNHKQYAYDGLRVEGLGITDKNELMYGNHKDKDWKDFCSGYPMLIKDGKKAEITYATELSYKTRRTCVGYNSNYVYVICVDSPGMTFTQLQDLGVSLGLDYMLNGDGGGSTRMMYNGETVTNGIENRAVDNFLAVWVKEETKTNNTTTNQGSGNVLQINENLTTVNYNKATNRNIKYLVIHYTANDGDTAYNNTKYFSAYRGASAHYFVDEKEIWRCVADENVAWHCGGDKQGPSGATYYGKCFNTNSIGIEMCSDKKNNQYVITDETIANTVALVKYLMKKYNIPASNVIRHYDVTGKSCPHPWVVNESLWNNFKKKIGATVTTTTTTNTNTNIDVIYQAYAGGKWWSEIKNYNTYNSNGYAGVEQKPMQAIKMRLSKGSVQYRVHTTDGKWWGWITDNTGTGTMGYAGVFGRNIDAVQMKLVGDLANNYDIYYRVSYVNASNYLNWIKNANGTGAMAYAGVFGKAVDKIQVYVKKK